MKKYNSEIQDVTKNKSAKFYYLTSVVFKEEGNQENSLIFLKLAGNSENDLLLKYGNKDRENGFKFKKNGNIKESIEAFSKGADSGDPVSQYELAKVLGKDDVRYGQLLILASSSLFQAQLFLYKFFLKKYEYEKANHFLMSLMEFTQRIKLTVPELPNVDKSFKVRFDGNKEPEYDRRLDASSGKMVKCKLQKPHDVFYDAALKEEDIQEKVHLYNLAALNGNGKSAVALYERNTQEQEGKAQGYTKQIIQDSKKGDIIAYNKLNDLIHKGDAITLSVMLEQFLLNIKDKYYIRILEEGSKNGSLLIRCVLAQMYYGEYIDEIGEVYTEGTAILRSKDLSMAVDKIAEEGNILAQYCMGIIGKENRDYNAALKWFSRSAICHLPALHELGSLYERGIYTGIRAISTDPEQAEVCYRKCAELGYARSQHALGLICFHKKDFEQAIYWLEKSTAQGYKESIEYLKGVVKDGYGQEFDEWATQAIVKLEKIQPHAVIQLKQGESEEKPTQKADAQEKIISSSEALQEGAQHGQEEEFKAGGFAGIEEGPPDSSNNKKVLAVIGIDYANSRSASEAQIDALLAHVEREISTKSVISSSLRPESPSSWLHHDQGLASAIPHSRQINPLPKAAKEMHSHALSQEEAQGPRTVSLTREGIFNEKLINQAEFFVQTGVMFDTLENAAQEGGVDIIGNVVVEENKEEGFWSSLPDFGHSLDSLLQAALGHDGLHVDVDSYFG